MEKVYAIITNTRMGYAIVLDGKLESRNANESKIRIGLPHVAPSCERTETVPNDLVFSTKEDSYERLLQLNAHRVITNEWTKFEPQSLGAMVCSPWAICPCGCGRGKYNGSIFMWNGSQKWNGPNKGPFCKKIIDITNESSYVRLDPPTIIGKFDGIYGIKVKNCPNDTYITDFKCAKYYVCLPGSTPVKIVNEKGA